MNTIYYYSKKERGITTIEIFSAHYQSLNPISKSQVKRGLVIYIQDGVFSRSTVDLNLCSTGIYHEASNFKNISKEKFMEAYSLMQDFLTNKLFDDGK